MRYVKVIGSVGIGRDAIRAHLVIRTDGESSDDLEDQGFEPIDERLSDADVMRLYGVAMIHEFGTAKVN